MFLFKSPGCICMSLIPILPQHFHDSIIPCYSLFRVLYDQGVPMIYMGDEYGHTKGGNNNTYCHDNFVILYSDTQHCIRYSLSLSVYIYMYLAVSLFILKKLPLYLQINYFRWDKMEEAESDFFRFCCLMTKFRQYVFPTLIDYLLYSCFI